MPDAMFPQHCLIELFSHGRIAGLVSEAELAGVKFLRVEVPPVTTEALFDGEQRTTPGYAKYVHPNAVFALQPMTEAEAQVETSFPLMMASTTYCFEDDLDGNEN